MVGERSRRGLLAIGDGKPRNCPSRAKEGHDMRGRQHAWTPIVLHWRRRRALVQPARPLLLRSHCAIHNVHNSTSLHIWQLTAATINRSFERVTTLIRTMRENTAPLFASRVIDPVSLRHTSRHAITTTRELRVLRETQRHLEHSFVRTFRMASFTTRETSLERQLLYVFRT